jgi:hypothetical protein
MSGGCVPVPDGLILQVVDANPKDAAEFADDLRTYLLDLNVASVRPVDDDNAPEHAKGLGTLAGWMLVKLGRLSTLRQVISASKSFAARTHRTIEVSIGSDVLRVTGVSDAQQDKIIEAWLAKHS